MSQFDFSVGLSKIRDSFTSPGVYSFLITLLVIAGGLILNRLIIRVINRELDDTNRRHVFRKLVNYSTTVFVVLILLGIWIRNLTFLTAITGFLAAGLAIALRDVIMSFFGWFKILWARPFTVGDRIQVQELEGDVIDITPLHTVLLEVGNWVQANQSTGRIVFIPNNIIFVESVFNSSHGFPYVWDEFSLVVTFESDLETAHSLMKEPVEEVIGINYRRARKKIQEVGDRYAIRYENIDSRTYMSIVDHGVQLTLRYLSRVRGRREIKSRLSKKIMSLLTEHSRVELAYPTYRIYQKRNNNESNFEDVPNEFDER